MKKLTIIIALIFGLSVIVISAQISDSIAPEIREVSVTPDSVDVRNNAQTVTFFVRATDVGSGVSNVTLYLHPGSEDYLFFLNLERVSGDANDGIYMGIKTIASSEYTRMWTLSGISASDATGNRVSINSSEFAQRGFATSFQVISNYSPPPPFNYKKRFRVIIY